jgi:peptidoglycan hydrolase CwlO-like protein
MSDTDSKILEELKGIRSDITNLKEGQQSLQADVKSIQAVQQEQGKKLDDHSKKLDRVIDEQAHMKTTLEVIEDTIKETKEEVCKFQILTCMMVCTAS